MKTSARKKASKTKSASRTQGKSATKKTSSASKSKSNGAQSKSTKAGTQRSNAVKSQKTSSQGSGKQKTATNSRSGSQAQRKPVAQTPDPKSQLMELFEHSLKDMYWAEKALTRAIPKMVKKAESKTLVKALQTHLKETEKQVTRLEKVFQQIGKKATAKKCVAMDGLIKEAEEIMGEAEAGPMRDAAIIMAAQKVEHYEIASYGTMRQFAETLGMDTAADLLEMTLDEEKNADETLTDIATASINSEAAGSSEKSTQKSASKGPEKKGSTKNDKKKPTDEVEDEDDIDADEDDGDDEKMDDDDDTNQKKSMRTAGSDDDDDYDDADDVDEYEDVDNYDDGGDTEEEYQ